MPRKKTSSEIIYWDACVFEGWLKTDRYPAENQLGIVTTLEKAEAKEVTLVTSVLTIAEVRDGLRDLVFGQKFEELFYRDNFNLINVDESIAKLAQEIGHKYTILPPDAIHIASAVNYSVTCLHTFDGMNAINKGNGKKILAYAESILQDYGLKVEVPYSELPQPGLFDSPNL